MPLTEQDTIRIRQFLQKLQSGLIEGMDVYVTYHDSNLAATPSNPTGDGSTGGWHREPTEASNWMSIKIALKDTAGTWGTPIRVFGLQGTETAGVGLSADIPKLAQITFIGDGSSKVGWTAGTVEYGGNSYAIAVKAVGDGSTDAYLYWDDDHFRSTFKNTSTYAQAIAAHHWMVCINDSGKAIPAVSHRIILGGLIQAKTVTAAEIVVSGLDALDLTNAPAESGADVTGDHEADISLANLAEKLVDSLVDGTYAKMLAAWIKGGDVTKIDGGQISTGTILAAAIATYNLTAINATIENLMVKTAHIDNLNVTTGKIADDATHITESAYTAGQVECDHNETEVQTDDITSAGGVVEVYGSIEADSGALGFTGYLLLYEGATLMESVYMSLSANILKAYNIEGSIVPGSGSKTFTLKAYRTAGDLTFDVGKRSLLLKESLGK